MSGAGVHSSRGDGYQITIAADWAIRALSESIDWIELDSTDVDALGQRIAVDDVIIARTHEPRIYCQCKKNHPAHSSWTVSSLRDDLEKAGRQLASDSEAWVYFYSQNNFGELSAYQEYAATQPNASAFSTDLPDRFHKIQADLAQCWSLSLSKANATIFQFLRRLRFQVTEHMEDLRSKQVARLAQDVTQSDQTYKLLTAQLDAATRRFETGGSGAGARPTGRFTRTDLLQLLENAGSVRTPSRSEAEIDYCLRTASAVGRVWRRTIRKSVLPRRALGELFALIDTKPKTILIHDAPGYGKTCLLLDCVERLETSPSRFVLFIQGRSYAHCKTEQERIAAGLPPNLFEVIARAAEYRDVIVIIDSLDVLSLARDHSALEYFLSLIERLGLLSRVTLVAACRSFDLKYDERLAEKQWTQRLAIGLLDWEMEVLPLLTEWGIASSAFSPRLKDLLRNPRLLALFGDMGGVTAGALDIDTEQALTERYLDVVVRDNHARGPAALDEMTRVAGQMLSERRLDLTRARAALSPLVETALLSAEVIIESAPGRISFAHQSLLDVLAVRSADRAGKTLLTFILGQPQTPFVRPSIRAFMFYLRTNDPARFRGQLRSVLNSGTIAFHVKRLVCESLSEIVPGPDDWSLIAHVLRTDRAQFNHFYFSVRSAEWFALLAENWVPTLIAEQDSQQIITHADRIALLKDSDPGQVIGFWLSALDFSWVDQAQLALMITRELNSSQMWKHPNVRTLIERLVAVTSGEFDFLGSAINRFIEATAGGDDLLWRYIVTPTLDLDPATRRFDEKLRCGPTQLKNPEFLKLRMIQSDELLSLAVETVGNWAARRLAAVNGVRVWDERYVTETHYRVVHTRHEARYSEPIGVLFEAIEEACRKRALSGSAWWIQNRERLRVSPDGAMRYIVLRACCDYPDGATDIGKAMLLDEDLMNAPRFRHEVGQLISAVFGDLDEGTQDLVRTRILRIGQKYEGEAESLVHMWRRDLLASIPTFLRDPEASAMLDQLRISFPDQEREAIIESWGGMVGSPVSNEQLLDLSDDGLLRLLMFWMNNGTGGAVFGFGLFDQLIAPLIQAASRDTERFLRFLKSNGPSIAERFRQAIMSGVSNHLRFRFGNLSGEAAWTPRFKPDGAVLSSAVLDELESHPLFWSECLEGAQALNACAYEIDIASGADRFASFAQRFWRSAEPSVGAIDSDKDLLVIALNSARGIISEGVTMLASRISKAGVGLPPLLEASLEYFAGDRHPAVRAISVHGLPTLQHYQPDLGWKLFALAMREPSAQLWQVSERCFYYAYQGSFSRIAPFLDQMEQQIDTDAGTVWGRICALAVLSGHINRPKFFLKLDALKSANMWSGAVSVFAANAHQAVHSSVCFEGLQKALVEPRAAEAATKELSIVFSREPAIHLPKELILLNFKVLYGDDHKVRVPMHNFQKWLTKRALLAPDEALDAAEIALGEGAMNRFQMWDDEHYPALLTRLFREGEEREELDKGSFLKRTIALQDMLIRLGALRMNEWLKDAERPS